MDIYLSAFDSGFGGKVRHFFECGYVFGTAIGIAGIVHRVDANKNMTALEYFCPGERKRQHNGITGRHIRDRYSWFDSLGRYSALIDR